MAEPDIDPSQYLLRQSKSVALSHSQLGLPLFHFYDPKHSHRYLPKEDDIHPETKLPASPNSISLR